MRDIGARGGFTLQPLISTFSASSYAKDISSGNLSTTLRESGDESGPFTIAFIARRLTRNAEGAQVYANVFVAGANKFDDQILSMFGNSFYNIFLLSNIAIDLNPFGDRVYIPAKDLTVEQMLVSAGGTRTILVLMVIILPLAIITTGVFVWRKRRHQ